MKKLFLTIPNTFGKSVHFWEPKLYRAVPAKSVPPGIIFARYNFCPGQLLHDRPGPWIRHCTAYEVVTNTPQN